MCSVLSVTAAQPVELRAHRAGTSLGAILQCERTFFWHIRYDKQKTSSTIQTFFFLHTLGAVLLLRDTLSDNGNPGQSPGRAGCRHHKGPSIASLTLVQIIHKVTNPHRQTMLAYASFPDHAIKKKFKHRMLFRLFTDTWRPTRQTGGD